jgi:hypothetical protein
VIPAGVKGLGSRIRTDGWWGLWALLGLGLLLRLGVLGFYGATVYYYSGDATRYMRLGISGVSGLFGDNAMPAGYPAFLAILRHVDSWLPLTIFTQHLLGLVGAVLLYAAVRSVGTPRWAALLPVAVVALNGDELFVEHGILTEALWMPLLALAMYLVARSIRDERPRRWLVAGGVAIACTALVRSVSDVLPVVVAIWAAIALPGRGSTRLKNAAALLLPAIVVLGIYFAVSKPIAGGYSGLTENSGFSLYARVAQFADCSKFTPPPGTRRLCVATLPSDRPGPFYWAWDPRSPLRTKFHFNNIFDSKKQEELSSFARQAIVHQPVEYALTVARDFSLFFIPGAGTPRPYSGQFEREMSFGAADAATDSALADEYEEAYRGVGSGVPARAAMDIFGGYQSLFRIDGRLLFLLIVLGLVGCFLGPAARRSGAALFLASGFVLLLLPPLVSSYDVRYALPPINLFAAAAALGIASLVERLSADPRQRKAASPARQMS